MQLLKLLSGLKQQAGHSQSSAELILLGFVLFLIIVLSREIRFLTRWPSRHNNI